jgi:hypothetical protein
MARRTVLPTPPRSGDDDLDALYQAPFGEFIEARNALATRLRKAGDAAASARVRALPKPSAPAWALNQVYWHARADYDRMIAAGDRLRSLQQQMLGGRAVDPRDSMQERQAAVRQVVDRAARFLAEGGQPATEATRQRINVTADALATWGSQPQGYVPGRLDHDIDPPGFAALASLGPPSLRLVKSAKGGAEAAGGAAAGTHTTTHPATRPRPTEAATPAAKRAAARAAQEAARARAAARRRLADALHAAERDARQQASARERAATALSRAAADAASAAREVTALETQLTALRARLDRAERARAEAETAAADADRAHAAAEAAADRARRDLEQADAD